MSRRSNYVSKATDGIYTVAIKGNQVTVTDEKGNSGTRVFTDGEKFDIGKGFWNCFKQIKDAKKKISVGNKVKVVDPSKAYVTYWQWFSTFGDAERYMNSDYPIDKNIVFTVTRIAPHQEEPNNLLYCLEDMFNNIYLLRSDGIQKV